MKIMIDTELKTLSVESENGEKEIGLYTKQAFELLSKLWLKIGWNQKYQYTFTWLGRPIIQLPDDLLRIQEVIYQLKPDVIIETGIAHGGSLIFWASLCKVMDKGRVIGVDIEIRPHNRRAIEAHELFSLITLVEGSSINAEIVSKIKSMINPDDIVLVLLDSNHTEQHVLAELEAYCKMVSLGSYIVATDGIMMDLYDVPRGNPEWQTNNPTTAVQKFILSHPEFIVEQPQWAFNESDLAENITHWPNSFLKEASKRLKIVERNHVHSPF